MSKGGTIAVVVAACAAVSASTAVVCVSLGLDGVVAGGLAGGVGGAIAPVISRRLANR